MTADIRSLPGNGTKRPGRTLEQLRKSDLAKIHIACQQLHMDDATYRDMLWLVARVKSSKQLDAVGRQKVLKHLQSIGAVFKKKRVKAPRSKEQLSSKIIAMMLSLKLSDSYLDSMAQKMFSVEKWEWLELPDLEKLMMALAIHQRRQDKK